MSSTLWKAPLPMKLPDPRVWLKRIPFFQAPPPSLAVLVPGERFFVRRISILAEEPAEPQVVLALESLAPFPLDQTQYGWLVSPDGKQALVYAAYRRLFSPEELQSWITAPFVAPAFLALVGEPPIESRAILHTEGTRLTGLVWLADEALPTAVVVRDLQRPPEASDMEALARELTERVGHTQPLSIVEVPGETNARVDFEGRVHLSVCRPGWETPGTMRICVGLERDNIDVRDHDLLKARAKAARIDLYLWRGCLTAAATIALALALEVAQLGMQQWNSILEARAVAQAPEVARIETAQTLATRIEELIGRRLMPMEMLAVVNEKRPPSIRFLRSAVSGFHGLEIEAQTPNAADVGRFESALRAMEGLAKVETRDIRSRDGTTTFVLNVVFNENALQTKGGAS